MFLLILLILIFKIIYEAFRNVDFSLPVYIVTTTKSNCNYVIIILQKNNHEKEQFLLTTIN